ncbi:diguanylate cyclase [Thalassomonas haliotis]|uniref:diguanylate cyclase n=1 Tax=Thalassomonas haliotis TaxID=485448 RepID=A0ABY7VFD8_9GAMM|nr:diguanylate cyclase [Thalassomonas haliotis]WDE12404.1 diguanylate cyclase [Thalassomonas haliotis]
MFSLIYMLNLPDLAGKPVNTDPALIAAQTTSASTKTIKQLEAGLPFLRTFSAREYGAQPQNWAIVQDLRGIIYVGNAEGVLEFDGQNWRLIKVANQTAVRSLAVDERGRVYVGAVGEIGYLEVDNKGQSRYISLLPRLSEDQRNFSDVWHTFVTAEGVIFASFQRLMRLQGEKFQSWTPANSFHLAFQVGERLFVREKGHGLLELTNNKLNLVPGGKQFADEKIYAMLPWETKKQGDMLVASRTRGLFLFDQTGFTPWPTAIDAKLKRDLIFPMVNLGDGRLAVGTLQAGIYFLDTRGNEVGHLSEESGLPDNAILALFSDRENGLWIATDNGLARAEVKNPLTRFDDRNGLVGVCFAVHRHQGDLYVGTAQGLYRLQTGPKARFTRLPGVSSQTWGLTSAGEELLVANYRGVYAVTGNRVTKIKASDAVMSLHRSQLDPKRVYIGHRHGLTIIRKNQQGWQSGKLLPDIRDEIRTIFEENSGLLWLGTKSSGVIRVKFSARNSRGELTPARVERFGTAQGLPSLNNNWVYPVSGEARFATQAGLLRFNESTGHFEPDPRFNKLFPQARPMWSLQQGSTHRVWLYSQDPLTGQMEAGFATRHTDGKYRWQSQSLRSLAGTATEGMQHIHQDDNGVLWLGRADGLYRYTPQASANHQQPYSALLRQVKSREQQLAFKGTATTTLAYADNALRFVYAAPSFDGQDAMLFSVLLEGNDREWSPWSTEDYQDYTNLFEGDYRFRVRAKNLYNTVSNEAVFSFTIAPPWYRSIWACAAYILTLLLSAWGLLNWRLHQVKDQKQALETTVAERTRQLATLGEIGRAITANLDLDTALETLYQHLNQILDASVFGIGLYHPEQGHIEFRLAIEDGKRFKPYNRSMNDKNQLAVWCIENRKPILIGDYPKEYSRYLAKIDNRTSVLVDNSISKHPVSLLYAPLLLKGKVIGIISVQSFQSHFYDASDLNILQSLAAYAAIAIDNACAHTCLEEISYTDALTGLYNRRFLLQHLEAEIALSLRKYHDWLDNKSDRPPSKADLLFFLVDIDHFKQVNDTYGHSAGDQVLFQISRRLQHILRGSDFLIRWGGEEFLIITRNLPRKKADFFAERLRSAIAAHTFELEGHRQLSKTCSIGFCSFPFHPAFPEALTWSQVIDLADDSLYLAKRGGRNAWVGFQATEATASVPEFKQLHETARQAIEAGELSVTTSLSAEALTRAWQSNNPS